MKIAVAYDDGQIFEHFGHCETFALYDFKEDNSSCIKTLVDCSDKHGHTDMANLMRDNEVAAVICGNMGDEARALLLSYGIVPVPGYCGHADTAAYMFVSGTLPVGDGGGCSGGCGGCSGCSGCGDEGEESGCGGCGCGGAEE